MGLLSWLVIGALSGWIASIIMKSNGRMGIFANIIVGVLGALIGGFILGFFGVGGVSGFNVWSIFVSVFGACILLFIINKIRN